MPSVNDKVGTYDQTYNQCFAGTHGYLRNTLVPRSKTALDSLARVEAQLAALTAAVDGVDETTIAGLLTGLKEQIIALAPELATAVAAQMDDLTPEILQGPIEAAMREVFGSLDGS